MLQPVRLASRALLLMSVIGLAAAQESETKLAKFEFAGRTLGGQKVDQTTFADNVVIVDIWGTWCPPCRRAVPVLVKLYEKYKQQGLEVVGLCYAGDGTAEDVDKVRPFAVENRITYTLVPGESAWRDQVPGFSGYPTLLMFGKGMKHERTHVGFDDSMEQELETWIRGALGLDGAKSGDGKGKDGAAPEAKEEVPPGKLFEPGNGDRGLELDVVDVHGKALTFAELRGSPVLLAITTSWDQEAVRTAHFLEQLRADNPTLKVVAWHIERDRDAAKKSATALAFLTAQKAGYACFATEQKVAREKVHLFASLPTLLVFDKDGVLVLREGGIADAIEQRVREKVAALVSAK